MVNKVTPKDLQNRIDSGVMPYILDVREQDEIEKGGRLKIDNVHYISMGSVLKNIDLIPMNRDVIVVCEMGGRCERVAKFLLGHGYSASSLEGGLQHWRAECGVKTE